MGVEVAIGISVGEMVCTVMHGLASVIELIFKGT